MTVSQSDVTRVAELANLELTADEQLGMLRDLNSILEHVAQLNEVDTSSVSPMAQVGEQLRVWNRVDIPANALREDVERPSLDRDDVMACAPDSDGVYFRVPKVIDR